MIYPPVRFRQFLVLAWACLASGSLLTADDDWLDGFRWREVGPTATGGRVTDIEVNLDDPHHILVASAAGGLWETRNNGTTWSCIFERENTTTIGDIAWDRNDPQTIWVGTGEANNQRSSLWGDGVYKSSDGGKSWTNIGLKDSHHIGRIVIDPQNSDVVFVAALGHLYSDNEERGLYRTEDGGQSWKCVLQVSPAVGVCDVIVDPKNPQNVLAATYERRRRAWNFDGAGPGSAIYRSTDGGDTFSKVTDGLPSGEIGRIGLDYYLQDPQIVYATVSNQNPAPSRGTSGRRGRLPGETLEEAPGEASFPSPVQDDEDGLINTRLGFRVQLFDLGAIVDEVQAGSLAQRQGVRKGDKIVSVAGTYSEDVVSLESTLKNLKSGDKVTVVLERDGETKTLEIPISRPTSSGRPIGGEIYRSEDGGASWTKVNSSPVGGSPAYYYGQIRVDPQDDQRIYVLSVPVYVSEDGGKTFRSNGAPSVHVDHHALWINPKNSRHVMLGNDGGFHVSYDRAATWDYVFNLPLAQFYAIGIDMQQPYHVYGGLQDNGSWGGPSRASGSVSRQDWYRVGGGDGFYVQVDPNDSNLIYSESQFGAINRYNRATGERRSIRPRGESGERLRFNWNSPILMSTHDSETIYFGANKLFKSYNRGNDWLTISDDLTTNNAERIQGNVPYCTITTIAESPLDKKLLLVGTDDGKVQLTSDGGKTWKDLSEQFPFRPEEWWCSRVEFSRTDKQTAFASFTGYREDDFRPFVYKTTDGGETWASIAANLPEMGPVNVIKQDPVNANLLYVGTEFGVFVSFNQGQAWQPLTQDLPRVSVQDLLIHPRDNDLVIGTHGRGIYILDDLGPLQAFDEQKLGEHRLFGIRDAILTRSFGNGIFAGDRKRLAPSPSPGTRIVYQLGESVEADDIKLVVRDQEGKAVSVYKCETSAGIHEVRFPQSPAGRRRRGPVAGPGQYTAELTIGEQKMTQKFELKR